MCGPRGLRRDGAVSAVLRLIFYWFLYFHVAYVCWTVMIVQPILAFAFLRSIGTVYAHNYSGITNLERPYRSKLSNRLGCTFMHFLIRLEGWRSGGLMG